MKKLLQINPVVRVSTSTGRIMQEIGELAMRNGWESYVAYSKGRDGIRTCASHTIPVGNKWDTWMHGLETRLFDRHGLASVSATYDFIKQLKEISPDIVHIHNIHGYFLNYPILFEYLSKSGIPVVWTVHDCWLYTGHCYYYSYIQCNKWKNGCGDCPQKRKFPASWWLDRSARNYQDKRETFTAMPHDKLTIVPVSDWIRGEMSRSFLKDYPFRVIHNGIDTEVFRIYDANELKKKYGWQGKRILLGVASIWSEEKGLPDFIKLAQRLQEDEMIVLVGVTEDQKRLLPPNIYGIRRTENIQELAKLYSAADVFVNPTWQDNYPTVNMEAIACGTPVVTYRTGGSIESVTEETGFIVGQGDTEELLDAIRTIEKEGKSCYVNRCRKYALEHFRKEDRYADYLRLYEDLIIDK